MLDEIGDGLVEEIIMTSKYSVNSLMKYEYSDIGEYIGEGYTPKPLRNDEIVDLLNSNAETISEQAIQLDYLKAENQHMKQVLDENNELKERIKELEKI